MNRANIWVKYKLKKPFFSDKYMEYKNKFAIIEDKICSNLLK